MAITMGSFVFLMKVLTSHDAHSGSECVAFTNQYQDRAASKRAFEPSLQSLSLVGGIISALSKKGFPDLTPCSCVRASASGPARMCRTQQTINEGQGFSLCRSASPILFSVSYVLPD